VKIGKSKIQVLIVYINILVDATIVNDNVIRSLSFEARSGNLANITLDMIKERIITVSDIKEETSFPNVLNRILAGDAVVFVQGAAKALIVSARGTQTARQVTEPATESVIRGPREGFVETLQFNVALLRRKLKNPKLRFEDLAIGSISQTTVFVAYLEGLADQQLIQEVRERLSRIKIDAILESGYIEELIHDAPLSPFPTIQNTERPDTVAASLLEGRVAILVDGTPMAMIVPATFVQLMQVCVDYYQNYLFASIIRLLRYVSFFATLLLPSLYIAVTSFHQEMLPTTLALRLAAARGGIPFPSFVEALIMEVAFEILRESGIRLPRPVGQAVSIVGALVIGEAAVRASIVSPVMVIIVSTTAIASFTIPNYAFATAVRLLRFPMMALAASLGFFGILMGGFALIVHMASLRSFGIPYLAPIAPANWPGHKDVIVRAPWWAMTTRPLDTGHQNPVRVKPGQKPEPPKQKPGGKANAGKR
jgi:spore germination protein KA